MSIAVVAPARVNVRRAGASLQRRIALTDVLVVALVMVISHGLRFGWDPFVGWLGPAGPAPWWVTVAIAAMWILQLSWTRSRDIRFLGQGPEEYARVASAGWHTFAAVAIVGFFTQWTISRGYLLFALPLGTLVLFGYRAAWRAWLQEQRSVGRMRQRVVLAGPQRTVEQMIRRLRRDQKDHPYEIAGVCLSGGSSGPLAPDIGAVAVLGAIGDAPDAAGEVDAEFILLAGTEEVSLPEARRLEFALEDTGVGLIVASSVADVAIPRVAVSQVAGLPLMHVDPPRFTGPTLMLKYAADKVGALVVLAVAGIPMIAIAIAVKATSPGPVLFRQRRVGMGHEPFEMLKFRSMYVDAEARKDEVMGAGDDGNGVLTKRHDDPRVTRIGRVLRRYSLDELPQLFNVLLGDMSLVGPRPPLPAETEMWDEDVSRRQLVRPGMTGLWQVSGRSNLSWEESVRLDLHYTQNWTLALDAVIVLRTVRAVLAGRGAY
ncbi:sugar transferase [Demequina mangrovi]|uniref:Exopolysaccharide biosynthesis polyprenyl glycosylphosphotransferase n=1 Tax=Demequina mangrovi TaxID=1043493 RepID=A0A1H6YIH3_9MICO|nr:sugar transferase [Demequina mangrovi]SEJ41101.1 exopolysaccharide biosynthesis polyprenyl glycosylphosphotransferase [Demequina mangrovi]